MFQSTAKIFPILHTSVPPVLFQLWHGQWEGSWAAPFAHNSWCGHKRDVKWSFPSHTKRSQLWEGSGLLRW